MSALKLKNQKSISLFTFLCFLFILSFNSFGATCSISDVSLPFQNYSSLNPTSQTLVGSSVITCTDPTSTETQNGVIAQIELTSGQSANTSNRYLTNGIDELFYNIYTDSTFTTIWSNVTNGNGSPVSICLDSVQCGTSLTSTPNSSLTLHFYGSIPPNQDVSLGTYTDTLQLQIVF